MVLLEDLYESYFYKRPPKNSKNGHFWAFLGWVIHFPKEYGHEIRYGKALSVGSAHVGNWAKSDNSKVPKNGPKVARKVVQGGFKSQNYP